MKKETREKIGNGLKKGVAIVIMAVGVPTFVACNNARQTTPSVNPDPKPPIVVPVDPVVKTVSVDKIYNDNFYGTSFNARANDGARGLANRVLEKNGHDLRIIQIAYDSKTNEMTFKADYDENGADTRATLTFAVPKNVSAALKDPKAAILKYAELNSDTKVKESEVNSVVAKIQSAINAIYEQVYGSIVSMPIEDVTVEKEQTSVVETVTVGEIFDEHFADLDFSEEIENELQKVYSKAYGATPATTLFYSVDENSNKISLYFNLKSKKDSLNELVIPVPETLIDLHKNYKELILDIAKLDEFEEVEKTEVSGILEIINNAIAEIESEVAQLSKVQIEDMEGKTFITKTNNIDNHKEFSEKLFGDKEIIYAGVSDLGGMRPDEFNNFNTGAYDSFTILSVYNENENIMIKRTLIYVPTNMGKPSADIYNEFLINGKYKIASEETITITDPIEVQRLLEYMSASTSMVNATL